MLEVGRGNQKERRRPRRTLHADAVPLRVSASAREQVGTQDSPRARCPVLAGNVEHFCWLRHDPEPLRRVHALVVIMDRRRAAPARPGDEVDG